MQSRTNYKLLCTSLNIDACIVPGRDMHQLETPVFPFHLRHKLSGFEGSAGTLLFTKQGEQMIWSDGRYAGSLEKMQFPHRITHEKDWDQQLHYLSKECENITCVGLCTYLCSMKEMHSIVKLAQKHGLRIQALSLRQCVDACLKACPRYRTYYRKKHADVPRRLIALPPALLLHTAEKNTASSPLQRMLTFLTDEGCLAYVSTSLHEIAYLLGIRGFESDTMLFSSVLYLNRDNCIALWIPRSYHTRPNQRMIEKQIALQLQDSTRRQPQKISFHMLPYEDVLQDLPAALAPFLTKQGKVAADKQLIPAALQPSKLHSLQSPIAAWRSTYTAPQIQKLCSCLNTDSLCLLKTAAQLNQALHSGIQIREHEVDQYLMRERQEHSSFLKPSFTSIAASGVNSVMPHYTPAKPSSLLSTGKALLIDCGGHYRFGTTDITRVFYFAQNPPPLLIEDYSYVLKAHITLFLNEYPLHSSSRDIDHSVRSVLSRTNRHFNHGIGHGVGFCSDVHDGIFTISPQKKSRRKGDGIRSGYVISNEPAFYRNKKWGIRLENLVLSKESGPSMIRFEVLTFFPFQHSLIDRGLLNSEELKWLDWYQSKCELKYRKKLLPHEQMYLRFLCSGSQLR